LADEVIGVAFNRDFYSEESKTLIKMFNMYRDSCNVFIGCLPKFMDLDIQIQRLCKMRVTVVRRGIAIIHMQRPSLYLSDVWDIKNNAKIESEWTLKGSKNPRYARLTTVVGILQFGDLTPQQRIEYQAIKQEKRNKVFGAYNDSNMLNDPEKIFYNNLLQLAKVGKLTPEAFEVACKVQGKVMITVRKRLNAMLREEGNAKRAKDYIMSREKKVRRDRLGFVIKEQEQGGTT
jgi:hypothetical protein